MNFKWLPPDMLPLARSLDTTKVSFLFSLQQKIITNLVIQNAAAVYIFKTKNIELFKGSFSSANP